MEIIGIIPTPAVSLASSVRVDLGCKGTGPLLTGGCKYNLRAAIGPQTPKAAESACGVLMSTKKLIWSITSFLLGNGISQRKKDARESGHGKCMSLILSHDYFIIGACRAPRSAATLNNLISLVVDGRLSAHVMAAECMFYKRWRKSGVDLAKEPANGTNEGQDGSQSAKKGAGEREGEMRKNRMHTFHHLLETMHK